MTKEKKTKNQDLGKKQHPRIKTGIGEGWFGPQPKPMCLVEAEPHKVPNRVCAGMP